MVNKNEMIDYFDGLNKDDTAKGNTITHCLMQLCTRIKALEAEIAKLKEVK